MTDDPAQTAPSAEPPPPVPLDEPEPAQSAYVQLTEVEATPLSAADVLERRDGYGRIPVVVRIRRQPPINVWVIVFAIALFASGVIIPLTIALRALIIVGAVAAVVVGLLSRLFLRVPPGSVGLVVKGGRHNAVLEAGVRRVSPLVALSHLITTREIAFDVPVSEVRSSDGVGVNVDLMLGLRITDPVKFAYSISTGDADQLVHAAAQEAVRTLVRGIDALSALDLGVDQAATLRGVIDAKLDGYGLDATAASFTRVALPIAFTASLEARRLAMVQLEEQTQSYALERRRLADHAALVDQEAESRRSAVEFEAAAEAVRLARLEERLASNPHAAAYDLDMARIRVAERLATNSRAVVNMGGADFLTGMLLAREADAAASGDEPAVAAPAPVTAPDGDDEPAGDDGEPAGTRRLARGIGPRARRGAPPQG